MGRWTENPKNNVLSLRLTDEDAEQLQDLAKRSNKNLSDIARELLKAGMVAVGPEKETGL